MLFYSLLTLFLGSNQFSSMTHICLTVHQDSQVVLATPGSAEPHLPVMCVVWFWFKWCSLCLNSILCYWSQVTHRKARTPLQRDTCTLPGPLSLLGEQCGTVTHGQGGEGGRKRPCSHICSHHWSTAGGQSTCNFAQSSELPLEVSFFFFFWYHRFFWQFDEAYGFLKKFHRMCRITKFRNIYTEI